MQKNVTEGELAPRVGVALAAGVASIFVPGTASKAFLISMAGGLLMTAATGYCPITQALERGEEEPPRWRTLKTYRVEA